jgi:hypothetical protein
VDFEAELLGRHSRSVTDFCVQWCSLGRAPSFHFGAAVWPSSFATRINRTAAVTVHTVDIPCVRSSHHVYATV